MRICIAGPECSKAFHFTCEGAKKEKDKIKLILSALKELGMIVSCYDGDRKVRLPHGNVLYSTQPRRACPLEKARKCLDRNGQKLANKRIITNMCERMKNGKH